MVRCIGVDLSETSSSPVTVHVGLASVTGRHMLSVLTAIVTQHLRLRMWRDSTTMPRDAGGHSPKQRVTPRNPWTAETYGPPYQINEIFKQKCVVFNNETFGGGWLWATLILKWANLSDSLQQVLLAVTERSPFLPHNPNILWLAFYHQVMQVEITVSVAIWHAALCCCNDNSCIQFCRI